MPIVPYAKGGVAYAFWWSKGSDGEISVNATGQPARGGSWGYGADDARAAYRDGNNPAARSGISGFRLVVVGGGGASSPISIDILW